MIEYTVTVEENGDTKWYLNGKFHREDGPAVVFSSGIISWYKEGKLHRLDGPAIEYKNGAKLWYIEGKDYTEVEFELQLKMQRKMQKTEKQLNDLIILITAFVEDVQSQMWWGTFNKGNNFTTMHDLTMKIQEIKSDK